MKTRLKIGWVTFLISCLLLRHAHANNTVSNTADCAQPISPSVVPAVHQISEKLPTIVGYSNPETDIPLGNAPNPSPYQFDKSSVDCKNWIKAMECLCGQEGGQVAKMIVDAVNFIPFGKLVEEMRKAIENFKKKIGDRKFYVTYDRGKSTQWLTQKFAEYLPKGQFQVVDLSTLKNHLKPNDPIQDVVLLDDALYSGSQVSGTSNIIKQLCPTCHFHAIVPYSAEHGKKEVEKNRTSQFQVDVYSQNTLDTIEPALMRTKSDIPDVEKVQKFEKIFGFPRVTFDLAHTFFEHKVPDNKSVMDHFFRMRAAACLGVGVIRIPPHGDEEDRMVEFNCIPRIVPPYKGKTSSLDFTPRTPAQIKEDDQAIAEMLHAYEKNQCTEWRAKHPEFK